MEVANFDLLEQQPGTAYLLTRDDLKIAWTNSAFDRFSQHNAGPAGLADQVIGQPLLRFIPAPLAEFYEHLYRAVAESKHPLRHDYQCSSASECRWFSQYVLPELDHIAVINVPMVSDARGAIASVGQWDDFVSPHGFVTQCSHCRRIKHQQTGLWEVFRECFVETPDMPPVSHGLCDLCFTYFFDADRVAPAARAYLTSHEPFQPSALRRLARHE